MNLLRKFFPLIVLVILSYWSVKPLLSPGFFPIHDDTQVARVYEMHKALSDGMFPARWVQDLGYGYGYPIFNFYAPLSYYVGSLFMFIGSDALTATKLMIGLGTILSGLFMYLLAREFWGKVGGVVSGLLYLYAPYHALNIYVRGAIAELWAYAFLPIIFLATYKVYTNLKSYTVLNLKNSKFKTSSFAKASVDKQNSKLQFKIQNLIWLWVCVSSFSYAAVIASHNLTAMMVTPFLFAFALSLYLKFRMDGKIYKPYFIFLGILTGILLSAFYWVPVMFELKYTDVLSVVGGGSDYKDHFACPSQLWNSPWGFAGSAPGCIDGQSLKIGKIHVLLSLLSVLSLPLLYKKKKTNFALTVFFILSLLFSVFLTLAHSKFIWDIIPHMAFFQFPWRFLMLISFFTSLLGGAVFWILEGINVKNQLYKYICGIIALVGIIGIIAFNSKVFVPQKFSSKTSNEYITEKELKWRVSRISDEYMPKGFTRPINAYMVPNTRIVVNKEVSISSFNEKTQQISFVADAKKTSDLNINLAYFPGWHVFIDNNQEWFNYSNKGLIISVPAGKHNVDIKYIQTPVEKIGNGLSLTGIIILFTGIMINIKKKML